MACEVEGGDTPPPTPADRLPRTVAPTLAALLALKDRADRVFLCAPPEGVVLPVQRRAWTCGYDNLGALLCSALGASAAGDVSTRALQTAIEEAWRAGYDQHGAAHFGGKLVGKRGRGAYIGAAEMRAALVHRRCDATLVDIEQGLGAGAAVHAVAAACLRAGADGGGTCYPLILQDNAHSRTLVGATVAPDALLVADPVENGQTVTVVRPRELDGSQFQLLLLLGNPLVPLSDEAAATRRGSPAALAILRPDGEWAYSSRCALRFG